MPERYPTLTEAVFGAPDPPMAGKEKADLAERIDLVLHTLSSREAFVLRQRYLRRPRRSLDDLAGMLLVSRERVRQIEMKALVLLRRPWICIHLRPGLHLERTLASIREGKMPAPPSPQWDASDLLPDGRDRLLVKVFSLPFSPRVRNALTNNGIVFLGDLVQKGENELLRCKNFGRKSLKEVMGNLAMVGLGLGMRVEDWDSTRACALSGSRAAGASGLKTGSRAAPAGGEAPGDSRPAVARPPEEASWPVVRAYVPVPDVWAATGVGTAGIVRRQPDGRHAAAFFTLELLQGGLTSAFGKNDQTLGKVDKLLAALREHIPPLMEGSVELASAFAWGGRALGESRGAAFPFRNREQLRALDRVYELIPRPPGSAADWIDRLAGKNGLTPAGLLRVIGANPQPKDLPEGRETMIVTEMTFAIPGAGDAVSALKRGAPDFQLDEADGPEATFSWTRKYPKRHWSPLSNLGGRQFLGSVKVRPGELVAEARTLSMAARLAGKIRRLIGDGLRLRDTRWTGTQELLASASRSDEEP